YEQKAPLGFLWAERLAVELLGKGEMALRLFPLLCGLAALAAFVPVARHFLRPWAAALAVGLLALASPAVYHAVEAKQYSTELLASVLAL
ncbi:glycosyltransferase family 39 protein, partial [Rufibacter sp. H-1]